MLLASIYPPYIELGPSLAPVTRRPAQRKPRGILLASVRRTRPKPGPRHPKAGPRHSAGPGYPKARPRHSAGPGYPKARPRPRCPAPLAAGLDSASKNRPRPKGRPPPRRFAVFGPVYPKASPGPLLGTLLTDPGAPLGRRTRPGAFSYAPGVSEK